MSEEILEHLPGDNIDLSNDAEEVTEEGNAELAHMPEPLDAPGGLDSTMRVLTFAQCDAFKESQCRTADGLLRVVYNISTSTDKDFSAETCMKSKYADSFMFTGFLPTGTAEEPFVHEYYLQARRPFVWENTASTNSLIEILRSVGITCDIDTTNIQDLATFIRGTCSKEYFVEFLIKAGFDSCFDLSTNEFFVFDAEQVVRCDKTFITD